MPGGPGPQEGAGTRLAFCGNVFPGDTPGAVLTAIEGPVRGVAERLRSRGFSLPVGFGLYLAAPVAREMEASEERRGRLMQALARAGVEAWTANAFPFGGFHSRRVKERAFLPDWSSPERLFFTCHVIEVLAHLHLPGSRASLSTCPLGYGPGVRRSATVVQHLRRVQEHLSVLEERSGVRIVLALEPEPDGAFERVAGLAAWLDRRVLSEAPPSRRRIGVCWDFCHSAVVGESPAEVLAALDEFRVPLGKVQVSAALRHAGPVTVEGAAVLGRLARDPWFHQTRGRFCDGGLLAYPDLPEMLADGRLEDAAELRVHCHVPLHRQDLPGGLQSTDWRTHLRAAVRAGCQDFEVETYTLPSLPQSWLDKDGLVGTLAAEMEACETELRAAHAESRPDGPAG